MWTDFGKAIVNGIHLPGTNNVHKMLDYLFHDWRKFSKQSPPQGLDKLIPVLFQNGIDPQNVVNRTLKVFSRANEVCKRPSLSKKKQRSVRRQVDLLKENHRCLFSGKKMEQDKKKSELLSLIREYRFVREEELMFHIRKSMEEVQNTCQKVELSGKINVLPSELSLTSEECHI